MSKIDLIPPSNGKEPIRTGLWTNFKQVFKKLFSGNSIRCKIPNVTLINKIVEKVNTSRMTFHSKIFPFSKIFTGSKVSHAEIENKSVEKANAPGSISCSRTSFEHVMDCYKSAIELAYREKNKWGMAYQRELEAIGNAYEGGNKKEFVKLAKRAKALYYKAIKEISGSDAGARQYIVQTLNENKATWNTVINDIQFRGESGANYSVRSKTTPIREAGIFEHLTDGGTRGISSNDRTSKHLVNAWETELTAPPSTPNGIPETLFKGLRHGCINGDKSRADELIQSAIYQQLDGANFGNLQNGDRVKLNLASVQLLSHTRLAGDGKIGLNQIEELKKFLPADGSDTVDFTIRVPDPSGSGGTVEKTIKLELNLLTFNFGVNLQTRLGLGKSKEEDAINLSNLEKMLGSDFTQRKFSEENLPSGGLLKQHLEKISDPQERKIILELANQIGDLWVSGKYREAADNPYAMPARVALLTYKLGFVSSFNCKSGKDRTGVCDAEIKQLATCIEANGRVPAIDEKPTEVDRVNFTNMHKLCGSHEVLQACTGVHGSKIPFMKRGFYNRFAEEFREEFFGVTNSFGIANGG
ncbi:MAG: hypothetical protein LBJ94_00790 [Puniceicoccales bacterium]|jgi:hypothetical protein|nr:hypothetical protein [Puniceicoccales bacterium]